VADGHPSDVALESVYSGVVSLRGFRLVLLNSEFGNLEGHILIISKALYGICCSGKQWNDGFIDCIMVLGFFPCKSDPDIWMRKNRDIFDYVAVNVDDLAIAMKDSQ
jgi:hypothetical protein